MPRKTSLYDVHISLGGKMVDFAGFLLPVQYSGIIEEHRAVRTAVGMFDVSHMGEFLFRGEGAEAALNAILTNDIRGMKDGKVRYSLLPNERGGAVDDVLVYRVSAECYLMVVNGANVEKDAAWVRAHLSGCDFEDISESVALIAVQGPLSEAVMRKVVPAEQLPAGYYTFTKDITLGGCAAMISRTGYTGEDGFEIYASPELIRAYWKSLMAAGVKPCGLGCRDTLRFEAGLPLYGDELSAEISPVMAGLSMFCKFDKPEFIGKEAIAAQKAEGAPRRIVGIELQDSAVPRAGYPVELEDGTEVGHVTTGYHSITLGRSLCFALVDSGHAALGTPLFIRIRRRVFPGTVVKKRFYQTNYKK